MIDPSQRLRYLLENDAFAICPMLSAHDFVKFCRDRGVTTTEGQLERLEKLGIFFPIARVKWPRVIRKIEVFDEGRSYRDHGILKPSETWTGETREEWGRWNIDEPDAVELLATRSMWDPRNAPFTPWNQHMEGHEKIVETFYSMFQIFPLEWKLMLINANVDLSIFADGADPKKVMKSMIGIGRETAAALRDESREDRIAYLAQAISTRYFPVTRTDRRTFTLRSRRFDWSWYDFAERWDASKVCKELGISEDELINYQETAGRIARSRDPMERWYQLIRFIAVDKKDKLKGIAQFAQLLYGIEHMLRLFAKDAISLELLPPDEGPTWKNADFYGVGGPDDPLRHLEFVVNDYHLNARPKLILIVEGPSEEAALPLLAEGALGQSLSTLGIEVRSLGGVGEFTGSKTYDKYGALEKFIDDYHYRQTVVMIVLDKEGRVEAITKRLTAARSRRFPDRMLTRSEYIRIWKRCIEFDNFTHAEIAAALTSQAEGVYTFSASEVADAERLYDSKAGDPVSKLFVEKVGRNLHKVKCLMDLVKFLVESVKPLPYAERAKARPILAVLDQAVELASGNHQPVSQNLWEHNQKSGYFGEHASRQSP